MSTLKEDIKKQSESIVKKCEADGLVLDYTIKSLIQIDKLFESHSKNGKPIPGGLLSQDTESVIFSIGSYIGETIIKNVRGAFWVTNDRDPEKEIKASVRLPDGTVFWPIRKATRRLQCGPECSIYAYGHNLTKNYTKEAADESLHDVKSTGGLKAKKPWWKFW
jgi:hypothetical protein